MNTQKVVFSGVAGGVVYFLLGWLLYGILLKDFMTANMGMSASLMRTDSDMMNHMLYMIAGNMAFGFLLAIIFGRWANVTTLTGGLMAGAVIGLLIAGGNDCISYAVSNMGSRKWIAADIATFTVLTAVAGGVVAWVLGMGKK